MSDKIPAVLVDIDGVICHTMYQPAPMQFDWKVFMESEHSPIEAGVRLIHRLLQEGQTPVFITARPEMMREQTNEMLADMNFHGVLYMAPDSSMEDSCHKHYQHLQMIQKRNTLLDIIGKYDFQYAIDDQELNAKLFHIYGITTIQARFV